MYVQRISIRRFRHLEDIHLGPFAAPTAKSDLVALAGPNGGGKSSVLELLGYALSNSWSLGWQLSRTFPESSFEIALGISKEDQALVAQWFSEHHDWTSPEIREQLTNTHVLLRAFNYEGGQYAENPTLHNHMFSLVTSALRSEYQRPLGFFLRSDRYYPNRGFQQQTIFNFEQTRQKAHAWNQAFNLSNAQYEDMFDYLAQLRYHYFAERGAYEHRAEQGLDQGSKPTDPLSPYDSLLQRLLLGYRFAEESGALPTNLFIKLPSGLVLPFNDLSSGEKEVFFILAFFLRHEVGNAIILVDEPELHLHPELGRTLLQEMMTIRPSNQIWVATHNPEIVDEAGRDRVTYISRDRESHKAVASPATDEEGALKALRDLFGFSGFIGVGRSIVFLEGEESSSDRKAFSAMFPEVRQSLRFVPAGGVDNQQRINAAIMKILEAQLGWMRFYLIRDRDYLPPDVVDQYRAHPSGRVFVLNRYHIENYLLVPEAISHVLQTVWNLAVTPTQVHEELRRIAVSMSGEVVVGMTSYRLNLAFRAEDFSLGGLLRGEPIVDAGGVVNEQRRTALAEHLGQRVGAVHAALGERSSAAALEDLISDCVAEVSRAIVSDDWMSLFPGRVLLERFASGRQLGKPVALVNSIIKALGDQPDLVSDELRQIIGTISHDVEPLAQASNDGASSPDVS